MAPGLVERNLRRLNSRVRIFCGNDDSHPAGVYIVAPNGEYMEICGIDKNDVPEFTTYSKDGFIVKGGYRRVLKILVGKGLVRKDAAEKLFRTRLNCRAPKYPELRKDNFVKKLESLGVQIVEKGAF